MSDKYVVLDTYNNVYTTTDYSNYVGPTPTLSKALTFIESIKLKHMLEQERDAYYEPFIIYKLVEVKDARI